MPNPPRGRFAEVRFLGISGRGPFTTHFFNGLLSDKQETKSRRAALKELLQKGPKNFSKHRCRALGDAYFAAMAPAGKNILTTNTVDFEPLCSAVGKQVVGKQVVGI